MELYFRKYLLHGNRDQFEDHFHQDAPNRARSLFVLVMDYLRIVRLQIEKSLAKNKLKICLPLNLKLMLP